MHLLCTSIFLLHQKNLSSILKPSVQKELMVLRRDVIIRTSQEVVILLIWLVSTLHTHQTLVHLGNLVHMSKAARSLAFQASASLHHCSFLFLRPGLTEFRYLHGLLFPNWFILSFVSVSLLISPLSAAHCLLVGPSMAFLTKGYAIGLTASLPNCLTELHIQTQGSIKLKCFWMIQ